MRNNNNKQKPNKEFNFNQEKLENIVNKKNSKSVKIEDGEINIGEENLKDKEEQSSNIHIKPADEQQFENNSSDSDNIKQ